MMEGNEMTVSKALYLLAALVALLVALGLGSFELGVLGILGLWSLAKGI